MGAAEELQCREMVPGVDLEWSHDRDNLQSSTGQAGQREYQLCLQARALHTHRHVLTS